MKIACDRCSKIVLADSKEFENDWLSLSTSTGLKYSFCEKCVDVFFDTMLDFDEKDDNSDGACVDAVQVAHGHWISVDDRYSEKSPLYYPYRCSECNTLYWMFKPRDLPIVAEFCSHCGAKMDEEKSII